MIKDYETALKDPRWAWLRPEPTDSQEMQGIKSYWQMVLSLSIPERKLLYQRIRLQREEQQLRSLADSVKSDQQLVTLLTKRAHDYLAVDGIAEAEEVIDVIRIVKHQKSDTMKDIKIQREAIQWERQRLQKMQSAAPTVPNKHSSL